MRRFITAALLALFVCQSSGAAVAAPAAVSSAPSLMGQIQFAFSQTLSSFQTTHIGALLTGKEHQYEAMHATPPDFTEARKPHEHRDPDLHRPVITPIFHSGMPLHPRMLDPRGLDVKALPPDPQAMTKTAQSLRRRSNVHVLASPTLEPMRSLAAPSRRALKPMTVGAVNGSGTTGINPWWTYEEGALPGVGKWMVNIATGNLIVQENDVDIAERGIDLAFRRTYNSQSQHDYASTDNSLPSNFGNGWTNTFDAHIRFNTGLNASCPSANGITVYDIDGAQYDYSPDCNGHYVPPAGMHNPLYFDGGCGYLWVKKNGTEYDFSAPNYSSFCPGWTSPSYNAYNGRLYEILGRNHNNYIRFSYSWDNGDASTAAHLNTTTVTHSDGQQLVLRFADFSGYRELASITRPDGVQATYQYDGSGNLTWVTEPMNNSNYGSYNHTWNANHQLHIAVSPVSAQNGGASGATPTFFYDNSNRVTGVFVWGLGNFIPSDGTGQALQSGAQGDQQLSYTTFSYPSGAETQLTDADGHATNWFYDGSGRTTETQEWTGAPNNLWLTTYASWDGSNNLTETVDARGNATDYGYDGNGNTIWTQAPWITTSMGYGRPVARYSYDQFNNLVAYCDPQYIWTTGATSCNAGSGVTHYTWNYSDSAEPYGYLTDTYTPLGYHHGIGYNNSWQAGGDYGLPTDVVGDCMTQSDGTSRCPHTQIVYDGYGNVVCYSAYQDTGSTVRWFRAAYDNLNRRVATADADDGSLSVPQCSNTAGLAGSHIQSTTSYYQNGQVSATQSPSEYAAGVSSTYSYDADGNEISEVHHYGNQAGTTNKWYDGADRLVEVQQPHDPRTFSTGTGYDLYSYAWMTRYIYDLTQGGNVSVDGASIRAYGNLYKTQEYLPSNPVVTANTAPAAPSWMDVRGTSFDALDRALASYENAFGTTPKLTNTYDTNSNYGLLSQTQNAVGQQSTLTYTQPGEVAQKSYNDGTTPNETYTYDPDGRVASIASSRFGTESHAYDADGRLTSDAEPSGGGFQSPATFSYAYYPDGMREAISIASSALAQSNALQYSYRADGELQTETSNVAVAHGTYSWTYTPAGRELTQRDPYTGAVITLYDSNENPVGSRTLQARSFTYDGYGRVSQLTLPEGYSYYNTTYDDEGERLSYTAGGAYCGKYGTGCGAKTVTSVYGIRGELLQQYGAPGVNSGQPASASADGTICSVSNYVGQAPAGTCQASFDARSGMMLAQCGAPYNYDAAGRQIHSVSGPPPSGYNGGGTLTRAYDAENHVTSSAVGSAAYWAPVPMCFANYPSYFGAINDSMSYGWGPNGHPIMFTRSVGGQTPSTTYAHWSGDTILFTNNASGASFMVDKLAFGYGEVIDRDLSDTQVATHDGSGFSAWSAGNPAHPAGVCKTESCTISYGSQPSDPSWSDGSSNQLLKPTRPDGYDDGTGNVFQGVRVFDNSSGQWTAPDAYMGDVHDPMSQKPFMWNNNNPLEYSDPSGYVALAIPMPLQELELAQAAYNFLIGNDIRTLRDPNASTGEKVLAGLSLASNFLGPDGKAGETLLKVGIDAISAHAAEQVTERGITAEMVSRTVSSGTQYFDKANDTTIHVLEGAGPGGRTLVTATTSDGKKLVTAIDIGKKGAKWIRNKIKNGDWVKGH